MSEAVVDGLVEEGSQRPEEKGVKSRGRGERAEEEEKKGRLLRLKQARMDPQTTAQAQCS